MTEMNNSTGKLEISAYTYMYNCFIQAINILQDKITFPEFYCYQVNSCPIGTPEESETD